MAHGLHLYPHRHPPLAQTGGTQALRTAGTLLITLLLLALLFAVLAYLEHPN